MKTVMHDDSSNPEEQVNNDGVLHSNWTPTVCDENQQLESSVNLLDETLLNINKPLQTENYMNKQEQMLIDIIKPSFENFN